MNRKILYAIIAVIVVIILVVAVWEVITVPSAAVTMTVSVSSTTASVGQNLTFAAFISGGTPSKIIFNFGDGVTGKATHLLGNEYTVTHSYSSAGSYLVTANATVNGKYANNLKSIDEITVSPAAVSLAVASETTVPTIIKSTQIISPGSTVSLTASTLEPPTATNWTIGYYIWNFGDGATNVSYTVFNSSSGSFMPEKVSHLYSTAGIYAVTLGVITFNATGYVPTTYTSNGINYTYYSVTDLTSILSSSGNYYNNTYLCTIVVNPTAQLLKSTVPVTNPYEITIVKVAAGGPFSYDPQIEYEMWGEEILVNVYETMVQYNGSSTTVFPLVATEIPTVANGGISANYLNYTFYIRSGLKFSNGDPVTAWDAYTSYVRDLLFIYGTPATPGWILAQSLLPGAGYAPNATSYQNITQAITVNNATQTLTFHLLKPDPAFLDYLASPFGTSIADYSWLVAHGAGITFTPAGFAAYMNQGTEVNYNNYVRYNAMGSGPYMIKNNLIGQSVTFAPNPYYTPIAGVLGYDHAPNTTIYLEYEKDAATALLVAENGQADIVENLPSFDYPILAKLQSEGKIDITSFPTLTVYYFEFNFNINTTLLSTLGAGYSVPQYYFTNLDVRRAFAYAFNYTNYINNLVGNAIYGANFGFIYTGGLPKGMLGAMNATELKQAGAVVPVYNLTIAKQYMEESGLYNTSINIPIVVFPGDPVDYAAVEAWAATLHAMDPNIHANALYVEITEVTGFEVPQANPMPICLGYWPPDYPFPSDIMGGMYQEYGWFGSCCGWNPQLLASVGQTNQSNEDALMNQYIADAESTGNLTLALKYYEQAEVIGVNLTLYTYTYQVNGNWFYSSALTGFQYEQNPMYSEFYTALYIYLTK